MSSEQEVRETIEMAFGYRGDITLTLKDGKVWEGYIFDRDAESAEFAKCSLRLMPRDTTQRMRIAYADVASLVFSGRDTAAGKSFETWVKKYKEKKAAGEKNISIEPDAI